MAQRQRVGILVAAVAAMGVAALAALAVTGGCAAGAEHDERNSTMAQAKQDGAPRKVIVGTCMQAFWGEYPGLDARLAQLGKLVDEMAAAARKTYGRSVDVVALPEVAVNGGKQGPAAKVSFPLEGPVLDAMGAKAREHHCYITVPMYLTEDADAGLYTNVCVLLDRDGQVAGIYRKVHVVAGYDSTSLEGGCMPGKDFPVFQCDFGRLGIQICWDITYDDGWETLGRKGAELVIWSTQSPGRVKPASHAMRNGYFVLTSTWRNNAVLIDPIGREVRAIVQADGDPRVMVQEIDLEFAIVGWQPKLRNGEALKERYGDRVGFRYSEAEDGGVFWSNDPATPIRKMLRECEIVASDTQPSKRERDRQLQTTARGGAPETADAPLNHGPTAPGTDGWRAYWGDRVK